MKRTALCLILACVGLVCVSLGLFMTGCGVFPASVLRRGPVPSPGDTELIFSHKKHYTMTIECTACHPRALDSQLSYDNLLPVKEACMQCHKPNQQCALCHTRVSEAITLQARQHGLRFSHKQHQGHECVVCHGSVVQSQQAGDGFFPSTVTCRKCHRIDSSACHQCHERLGSLDFLPLSHDGVWLARHKYQSADSDLLCEQCHRATTRAEVSSETQLSSHHQEAGSCADCHRGDIWPSQVHDNNYIQSHSIDAQLGTVTCLSCHQREECQTCHDAQSFNFSLVHSEGWQFDHGEEARRRLMSCTACHVESDCLGCHQTVSPHGVGWKQEQHSGNESVCQQCHTGPIPN